VGSPASQRCSPKIVFPHIQERGSREQVWITQDCSTETIQNFN
jgi:hypothetical protein